MGKVYLVTRHEGASAFLQQRGYENAELVAHFSPSVVKSGDRVVGNLPLHLIAEVSRRGGRFFTLSLDLPEDLRGVANLSLEQMQRCNPRLEEYQVKAGAPRPDAQDLFNNFLTWFFTLTVYRPLGWLDKFFKRKTLSIILAVGVVFLLLFLQSVGMEALFLHWEDAANTALPSAGAMSLSWQDYKQTLITFFTTFHKPNFLFSMAFLALFFAISFWIYSKRNKLLSTYVTPFKTAPRKKVLIQGLSSLFGGTSNPNIEKLDPKNGHHSLQEIVMSEQQANETGMKSINLGSWQQNIRALYDQRNSFERIFIITSKSQIKDGQETGSFAQYETFKALIASVLKNECQAIKPEKLLSCIETVSEQGFDFEDYNDIVFAIKMAIKMANNLGYKQEDMIIDITTGTKPFSIAGAIMTLNQNVIFSYVNNSGKVLYGDASIAIGQSEIS
jgi:CRISPR-associated protein Csx16